MFYQGTIAGQNTLEVDQHQEGLVQGKLSVTQEILKEMILFIYYLFSNTYLISATGSKLM